MNPFEKMTPLTEEEKKTVREKLMKGAPKLETKEEKEQRRAEFAKKMAGKSLDEIGKEVVREKYVPGSKEQAA
jgi:ribosomal protein S25